MGWRAVGAGALQAGLAVHRHDPAGGLAKLTFYGGRLDTGVVEG
jgi:hypothetical protein